MDRLVFRVSDSNPDPDPTFKKIADQIRKRIEHKKTRQKNLILKIKNPQLILNFKNVIILCSIYSLIVKMNHVLYKNLLPNYLVLQLISLVSSLYRP